jgi:hypothetical protein
LSPLRPFLFPCLSPRVSHIYGGSSHALKSHIHFATEISQ